MLSAPAARIAAKGLRSNSASFAAGFAVMPMAHGRGDGPRLIVTSPREGWRGVFDVMDPCGWCGGEIPLGKRIDAEYCSDACRETARKARFKEQRLHAKAGRWCEWCGVDMPAAMRGHARYCSKACGTAMWWDEFRHNRRAARRAAMAKAKCQLCEGAMPITARAGTQFCSAQCRKKAWRARRG